MKRSLIWRSIVISAVLLGWLLSLFPLKDKDVLDVFRKLSAKTVVELREDAEEATADVADLKKKLEALTDKEGEKAAKFQKQLDERQAEADKASGLVTQYDELMARVDAILKDSSTAPYRAILDAAQGDVGHKRVRLSDYISIPTRSSASNKVVMSYIRRKAAGKLHLGLDLKGGTEFVIGFDAEEVPAGRPVESVRDQIIEILRNRVDVMGLVEPELKPTGPNSISLRMPSVTEGEKADIRSTIKATAKLEFRLVDKDNAVKVREYNADPRNFHPNRGYEYAELETEEEGEVKTEVIFISKRAERIRGEDVERAMATFDEFGNWAVSLAFNTRGSKAFAAVTSEHVNERLAIVMDGKVYSAPVIREAITGGRAEINGSFSAEEARRLAGVIESGNLPVSISIDSEFGTDPTLGRDSIQSGIWAAATGMGLVLLFMIYYYRFAGVVAIIALFCNLILVLGTLTLTGATITLPGIAGMVLTIGMAVDANVLIFERIREELLNGKTIGNALKAGYGRAFVTILDSNLTTLLTALILYRFGTGSIKGFAVTLSVGIIASMFTALFMTRLIFDLRLYTGSLKAFKFVVFKPITDCAYNFLSIKKITAGVSITVAILSIVVMVARGSGALSIDFAGGTEVAYAGEKGVEPSVADVRAFLKTQGFDNVRVGYKSSPAQGARLLEFTLPQRSTDESGLDMDGLLVAMNQKFPDAKLTQVQTNSVGGLVGKEFQRKAILAAVLATLGIIIYISFRFEFAYAVASVVALIHDIVIAAGIYLMWGFGARQLSLPVVAALLTIMGYSLNDTIVVFDRIREDLSLHRGRSYVDIINLSINQTLSRTLLTSLTTLLVVLTLYLFGGGAINDFAVVMLVGVIVGTYSSVFVASAIIASWHKHSRDHVES